MKSLTRLAICALTVSSIFSLNASAGVDLRPFYSPVKNQLYRGSCSMFAAMGAMEIFGNVPRLSEAYAYANLKSGDLNFDGSNAYKVKAFLEANKMLPEKYMGYEGFGVFGFNEKDQNEVAIANKTETSTNTQIKSNLSSQQHRSHIKRLAQIIRQKIPL
jgi:hypothetical protein